MKKHAIGQPISADAAERIARVAEQTGVSKTRVVDAILTCIEDDAAAALVSEFNTRFATTADSRQKIAQRLKSMTPEQIAAITKMIESQEGAPNA